MARIIKLILFIYTWPYIGLSESFGMDPKTRLGYGHVFKITDLDKTYFSFAPLLFIVDNIIIYDYIKYNGPTTHYFRFTVLVNKCFFYFVFFVLDFFFFLSFVICKYFFLIFQKNLLEISG